MKVVDRIVAKLARLRELRPGDAAYDLRPPLPPAEVAEFERANRLTLPPDYREFLIRVANGGNLPPYLMALTAVRSTGFEEEPRPGVRLSILPCRSRSCTSGHRRRPTTRPICHPAPTLTTAACTCGIADART